MSALGARTLTSSSSSASTAMRSRIMSARYRSLYWGLADLVYGRASVLYKALRLMKNWKRSCGLLMPSGLACTCGVLHHFFVLTTDGEMSGCARLWSMPLQSTSSMRWRSLQVRLIIG